MSDEPVIINELQLTEAFVPTTLIHRERQLKALEHCLEPALQNRRVTNVFLVGPTGTGKTSVAKQVLEAHFDGRAACVNCWKYRTAHEVLSEILLTFRIPAYARESVGEQVRKLEKLAKSKSLVVYLDEVDRLVDRDLLYVLSRVGIGLVLSSTHYHTLSSLPSRITSSLGLSEIQFPKYTVEETIAIVRDRVEQSVRPGALRTSLLKLSAVLADGDARVALETIRRAALMAEHNNSKRIELADVKKAAKEANTLRLEYLFSKLNKHQRIVYDALAKRGRLDSGRLYRIYRRNAAKPVVDRAYRKYMKEMESLGLVKSEGEGRWRSYRHSTST